MPIVNPTPENIRLAGEAIRRGLLVGIPTETVYGIAADALNAEAVQATFLAKGRPADNPLIVHVHDLRQFWMVAETLPSPGEKLMEAFWPGPLTLVVPKKANVPMVTTGGLDTVAVRMPSHPVTQALILECMTPLSAPSANPFMGLSPTKAEHIDTGLVEALFSVLDGGACQIGLESTVVDVTGPEIRLLRPGQITAFQIEQVLGVPIFHGNEQERRSPGLYPRHYAPRTSIQLVDIWKDELEGITLGFSQKPKQIGLGNDPVMYARHIYEALFRLDQLGLAVIYVERPPDTFEWAAVNDRLMRAAAVLE
jgi:L-threonylcarbamoyladenylate synthase